MELSLVVDYAGLAQRPRLGWIGKERDAETDFGNFGVRNYEFGTGRFLSGDALWEEYRGWNIFHYSYNNPLVFLDDNGLDAEDVERIVSKIRRDLNVLWLNSLNTGNEWGGIIFRLDLMFDGRSARIDNIVEGEPNSVDMDGVVGIPEGRVEGTAHTHPGGTAFSPGDLRALMQHTVNLSASFGQMQIVEAGDVTYALEVVDSEAASAFARNGNSIETTYSNAFDAAIKAGASRREASIAGVAAVANAEGSGIKFYISTNVDQTKFREVE